MRLRLTLLSVAILLAVYTVLAGALYATQWSATWSRIDAPLTTSADALAAAVRGGGPLQTAALERILAGDVPEGPGPRPRGDRRRAERRARIAQTPWAASTPTGRALLLQVTGSDGTPLAGRYGDVVDALPDPSSVRRPRFVDGAPATFDVDGTALRVVSRDVGSPTVDSVQTALPVGDEIAGLRALALSLVIGGLLACALGAAVTWPVVGRALRPLERLRTTAETIASTEDASLVVPDTDRADETGRLARAFATMLTRLRSSQDRTLLALDAQRRFLAEASHQVRTPITSIRGNVDLLRRHPDMDPGERSAALDEMAGEAARLTRMTDELLALARLDVAAPDTTGTPGVVTVAPVVVDAVRSVRHRADAVGRDVVVVGADAPDTVAVDGESLRRVLDALVENAVVHGAGRVECRVDGRDPVWVVVTVSDEGDGVAPQDRTTVFERFTRGSDASGRPGTGLGLSIAAGLVRAAGGDIAVTDDGFTVWLPRAAGPAVG